MVLVDKNTNYSIQIGYSFEPKIEIIDHAKYLMNIMNIIMMRIIYLM